MKKLLTLSAAVLLAASAFGQGYVYFGNRDTSVQPYVDAKVTDRDTGAALSGTAARTALLGGLLTATPASLAGAGTLDLLASSGGATWVNFRTGGPAGYIVTDTRIVSAVAGGAQAQLQMVAWTGNFDTWQAAYTAALSDQTIKVGWSAPWTVTTASGATDPNIPRNVGLTAFSIAAIPEPGTMALAGLGAAALLIFRRRK